MTRERKLFSPSARAGIALCRITMNGATVDRKKTEVINAAESMTYELQSASCEITSRSITKMYHCYRQLLKKMFKEERLKHNNRLMVYAANGDNRDCRKRANNVKLERFENRIFTFFPSLM